MAIYQQQPQPLDNVLMQFATAQLAKKRRDYNEAISGYRAILAQQPELTPVRIQLASTLFASQQNNAAQEQFEKALSDPALPDDIAELVKQYLVALKKRDEWQFSFNAQYLNEKNVNNASSEPRIENTPFVKGASMLPQQAKGIGYGFGLARDFNLFNAHYLKLENQLYGKSYWTNHDFDDISNRLTLGYLHKTEQQQIGILPFYEQQWYGGHRYKRSVGGQLEWNRWFSPNWQLSSVAEYAQNFYQNDDLNGRTKLLSSTLLWRINPKTFVYTGLDYANERTKVRHYGYDLKSLRIGFGQEWGWGISTRLSFSISHRLYKAPLQLSVFYFDKRREDNIYQLNLTAWKRDWHLFGITPKLNFRWKKQDSNFNSLYSYSDKSLNLFFEKNF